MLNIFVKSLWTLIVSTNLVFAEVNAVVDLKQEVFPITQEFINKEFGSCPVEDGKGLEISEGAITRVTLGPNEFKTEAEIIDYSFIKCPAWGYSAFCGSAGCTVHVAINGRIKGGGNMRGWQLVDTGYENIILGYLHGSSCNGSGSMSCFAAYSWNGEDFLSLK